MEFKYFFLGVFFTLVLVFLSVILFNFGKNSFNLDDVDTRIVTPTDIITPTEIDVIKKDEVEESIQNAVKNKSFTSIEDYFNKIVNFRYEDEKKLEKLTPSEIIEKIDSLDVFEENWSFNQENEIVKTLESTYPENYSNAFICYSDNYYLLAFQFDKQNMINKISFSSNYKKLLD